jgi:hypothetical protein
MQHFLDLSVSINYSTCFRWFLHPSSGAQNCTYSVRYCQNNTAACCYRGYQQAAGIVLTITDAVCTVLCSWLWAEKPPETCIAIYRNKYIKRTLHLVGFTSEILHIKLHNLDFIIFCHYSDWATLAILYLTNFHFTVLLSKSVRRMAYVINLSIIPSYYTYNLTT